MPRTFQFRPRVEAAERIESFISVNKLPPHAKLPSERDMCEMWELNRTTLRSAIRSLMEEGKLYNKVGSGTFVAEAKLTRNLQDMLPFSRLVASAGKKLRSEVLSSRVMECNKQVSQRLRLPLGHGIFELIRLRLVDDEPVLIETAYLDCVRHAGIELLDFAKESVYHSLEKRYGTVVRKGQEQLGITYATEEESRLLGIERESPLFHLVGVASEEDGTPVEYFESVLRTDKIRFASVLTRGVKKGKKP
ncbi:MAG TPA: GntR family transcriptional regulator [Spirochaetales bacterium]|nr:GntR family transcriptional regulator [Spirochaetales bacterium]HRY55297.1 GntR family transcriptional regulator [Spirochaetia bacterium]HRZ64347.1 GntR family transcriptional regulator [Spirochaetia bacterium]